MTTRWVAAATTGSPPNRTVITPRPTTTTIPATRMIPPISLSIPFHITFDANSNATGLPAKRYKLTQGYLCLVADKSSNSVTLDDCGADEIGWTWDPTFGTWMVGSDEDKSSMNEKGDASGPRWFLGTSSVSCNDVVLVQHTLPAPPPTGATGISGWQYNPTTKQLTLTTCSSTSSCLDSVNYNEVGQVPKLSACGSANTMQWLPEDYIEARISSAGRLIAGLIVSATGLAIFLGARALNQYEKRQGLARATQTQQLLRGFASL